MIDDLVTLKNKFEDIRNKGWIPSMRNGTTGIGYTFECLIGKDEEQFPIPDYKTIEIKTRYRNSKYSIALFTAAPDGDYLYATKMMYDKFGFPDSKNPKFKVFYACIGSYARYAGRNWLFKLVVDRDKQIVKIVSYTKTGGEVNPGVSWSFNLLKEKLYTKLRYLAFVKADAKYYFYKQYFRYYQITFYMLKDFEAFLRLIEEDIIKVTFMVGVYRNGEKQGEMCNHGVRFDIDEENLEKLFIKVCQY